MLLGVGVLAAMQPPEQRRSQQEDEQRGDDGGDDHLEPQRSAEEVGREAATAADSEHQEGEVEGQRLDRQEDPG